MANNTVDMKYVIDSTPVVQASKRMDTMARSLEVLIRKEKSGAITTAQFAKAKKELRRTVDDLFPHWTKARVAVEGFEKSVRANAKALQVQKDALQKVKREVADYASARREAQSMNRAIDQQAQSLHRLKMATDSSYAATHKLQAAKKILKKEVRENGMTLEQYVASMRKVVQANKAASASAGAAAANAQILGKKTSRFGVLAQQTGYQVGDFAVQVQSGQNIMVAFGQQATQLVGTFSLLAKTTGAITLFAGLGILIPILTGIGAYFLKASDSSKTFEDRLDGLTSAVSNYKSFADIANSSTADLTERFGVSAVRAKEVATYLKDFAEIEAVEAMDKTVAALAEDFGGLEGELIAVTDQTRALAESILGSGVTEFTNEQMSVVAELAGKYGIATVEANSLVTALRSFKDAEGVEAQVQAASTLNQRFLEVFGSAQKIPEGLREVVKQAGLIALNASEMSEGMSDYDRAVARVTTSQKQQLALAKQTLKFGKDSVEVVELRARQEGINKGLSEEILEAYVTTTLQIHKITEEIERQVEAQKQQDGYFKKIAKAYEDGENLSKLNLSMGIEEAKRVAELLAKNMNISLQAALGLVNLARGAVAGGRGSGAEYYNDGRRMFREQLEDQDSWEPPKSSKGGSKKSPAESFAKYLEGLTQQAEIEGKLVGFFGEKRDIEKAILEARNKYAPIFGEQQEAELRATLQLIYAEKERRKVLEEAHAEQQSIADTLKSSMSDAFMSMVEGTKSFKDAVKDMARAVIKQLYDVLVVQRLVGSFDSKNPSSGTGLVGMIMGAFQAEGGAWHGGSQIQAYANGGVVGGPTLFPMAGGKTGLMGEAGPEAIMPLKRGANGKLGVQMEGGSGGSVVVNQSFNFSANGDDSVKKIIAQAAPSIANMAKQSVMDARRRGGSMKNTFG